MSKPLRVGIAGLGAVGASLVRLLKRQQAALASRTGREIVVAAVSARDRTRDRGIDLDDVARGKFDLDVIGHYARPDVFRLQVDTAEKPAVNVPR